jgi:predicted secreted protein
MTRQLRLLGFFLMLGLTPLVAAEEHASDFDRIQLMASADREVNADLIVASLFIEREGNEPAKLAVAVNEAMAWAITETRKHPELKPATGQYTSFPVYGEKPNRITAWHVRQTLRITGKDAREMGDTVSALQQRLMVESLDYTVSAEARNTMEETLTAEALARFQQRATQVAEKLGRSGYRVLNLDVGSLGQPQMPPVMYRSAKFGMMADAAPPAEIVPGTQNLSLTVSGSIQLNPAR